MSFKYLYEARMSCGCVVFYDMYDDGCCEICISTEIEIDHIEYCSTHGG